MPPVHPVNLDAYRTELRVCWATTNPHRRGARLAALEKRAKADVAVQVLAQFNEDWSPALAQQVLRACLGHGISRSLLSQTFDTGTTPVLEEPGISRLVAQVRPHLHTAMAQTEAVYQSLLEQLRLEAD